MVTLLCSLELAGYPVNVKSLFGAVLHATDCSDTVVRRGRNSSTQPTAGPANV